MNACTNHFDRRHRLPRQRGGVGSRGLTLAELIIGLLLLAIIGGATAAVAAAVSRGWQVGESDHTTSTRITRTMLRIQDKMQKAKVTGEWRAGSVTNSAGAPGAAILFWREDANGDGRMQMDETELLEYDPARQELRVWEVTFPDPVTRAANNGPYPSTTLSDAGAIDTYKSMHYVSSHAVTRKVLGAQFNLISPSSASQRPIFEFRLKFHGPGGGTLEYGTASPRARQM